jgi:hypothetical protein
MNRVLRPSDVAAVVGVIDPDANTAATYTTGWIDMGKFEHLLAIIMAGDLGSSATLDAKFQQATDSSGTSAKDVSGKAITQMTQASTDKSNKQALVNLAGEDLDVDGGFTHVRLSMTVATATSDSGAVVLGFDARYAPASENDADSVDEIVG